MYTSAGIYFKKSADFLVTCFCVIGDVTVSGLGNMGLLVRPLCLVCGGVEKKTLRQKWEPLKNS